MVEALCVCNAGLWRNLGRHVTYRRAKGGCVGANQKGSSFCAPFSVDGCPVTRPLIRTQLKRNHFALPPYVKIIPPRRWHSETLTLWPTNGKSISFRDRFNGHRDSNFNELILYPRAGDETFFANQKAWPFRDRGDRTASSYAQEIA